jgi:uncharacterized RDD family membrane protein YckC
LGDPVVTEQSSRPPMQGSIVSTTYLEHAAPSSSILVADLSYAGFWRRFVAFLIDAILVFIVLFLFGRILDGIGLDRLADPFISDDMTDGSTLLGIARWIFSNSPISLVISVLYYAGMESSIRQATLGKLALGIIVTGLNGERISFARATGRYLARLLSDTIFFFGYLIQPFTRKRQALHDVIASTLVFKK